MRKVNHKEVKLSEKDQYVEMAVVAFCFLLIFGLFLKVVIF
ncbi:MAG: hypothetical protein R3E32_14685 [Chitinophagales bacterium]